MSARHGTVNLTGTMYLGNGASFGNTVEVTGMLKMQDSSDAISASVERLSVGGASGSVQLGNNTTLTVKGSLADIAGGTDHGSITGNGTLRLQTTGQDKSYAGNVSANLVYEGAGTQTLGGEVTGSTVTVNNAGEGGEQHGGDAHGGNAGSDGRRGIHAGDGLDRDAETEGRERCDEFGGEWGENWSDGFAECVGFVGETVD